MEKIIRKLAKSYRWQNLYSRCKDVNFMRFFSNFQDFTKMQIIFMNWLELYSRLFQDLANKEKYISEAVIESDIRTDSYLLYKRKGKDSDFDKEEKEKEIDTTGKIPSIIFRKKR